MHAPLHEVIRERQSEILASWLVRFERSPLRFRRATKAATHTAQVANLVEALGVAAVMDPGPEDADGTTSSSGATRLVPGSSAARELERNAAFLGAQFASEGATGFDIAALLLELRDVITAVANHADAAVIARIFEWLTVVALDAFASAGVSSLRERVSDQLEVGTPIVELLPRVPACFLVGAPSPAVLGGLLARAWLLAVGTSAPCLIIDCGGLAEAGEPSFHAGLTELLTQADGGAIALLLSSARRSIRDHAARVLAERNISFLQFERLDRAVAHALEQAGYVLRQTPR